MSLSRAFTTRRSRKASDADLTIPIPSRSLTTKQSFSSGTVRHKKISAPVELISTTNMLSYNAPDIYPRARSSSGSSSASDGRSSSETSPSSVGTPMSSPGTSSTEHSPITPEPNHLSCYFGQNIMSDEEVPQLPARAPSHTKKSAEYLARKKSMSRMSPKNSISRISKNTLSTARSSYNMFNAASELPEDVPEESLHPFGNELAQVSELVEEYGSKERLPIVTEEEQELVAKGLFKFSAEDYMSELTGMFASAFAEITPPMPAMWI